MSDVTELHPRTLSSSSSSELRRVLIVGAGQMGSGIAQVCAAAGRSVWLSDMEPTSLDRARSTISTSAGKLHGKGQLTNEQLEDINTNISYCAGLGDAPVHEVDIAIEAASERLEIKLDIFAELDRLAPPRAILATNTSSIPITTIAAATRRPAHVIGMHFMNPVPILELVEVISGLETAPFVTSLVEDFARDLGKTPIHSSDAPGFIANRILMPLINEAFFVLNEGIGAAEDIDLAMKLGMRHPMGPLALADLVGLDTCLAIMEVLHKELGEDKYRPCPLLRTYVAAGRYGRKTGCGVYRYDTSELSEATSGSKQG